jgi:hypothetical protein
MIRPCSSAFIIDIFASALFLITIDYLCQSDAAGALVRQNMSDSEQPGAMGSDADREKSGNEL